MTDQYDLIATCAFGLEAVVRRELSGLGIESTIGESGRVHFRGDQRVIAQANIWLRTADRVLIRVAHFPASDFEALFESTRDISWGALISSDAAFPVTGRSIKSQLTSVPAVQRSVKRAVVDAMRRDHNTETLTESGAEYRIDVALLKDTATLTIDTTGRSLHRRGYRTSISKAPLKETLASAMVMLSYWKPDRPLIDPFCGSGTILIEAARIGRNIAPGKTREFAFEHWSGFPAELVDELREAAVAGELPELEQRLLGYDIDGRVLQAARDNALRAGVDKDMHFEVGEFTELSNRRRFGCLITNPPYGHRIGDYELDDLYQSIPEVLSTLPTWSHYFFTAYPGFEMLVGRKADRRRKLYNGRIECTYFQFHGPKPVVGKRAEEIDASEQESQPVNESEPNSDESTKVAKPYVHASGEAAFGQLDEKAAHQSQLFESRLRKRARHLRRWPTRRGITCYRVYERDIPEIPLIVDRYENNLHITEYERPHDRDPAQHYKWLELMAETAGKTLEVPKSNVYLKRRKRQRGTTQHEKVDDTKQRIEVSEGGLKFLVNLADFVDTGLFLDHRVTREMVREIAKDKTFLNLFAYTGAFSVYAAAGGARSTTSVDLSQSYLNWAEANMRLNGFDGAQYRHLALDVATFMREHPVEPTYDLVVVDPPTFSNSKRTEQDWDLQKHSVPMLLDLLPLVKPGGVIYFSNNFRRFKFDPSELPAAEIHEISKQTVPEDYRNKRIHRCWRIVR